MATSTPTDVDIPAADGVSVVEAERPAPRPIGLHGYLTRAGAIPIGIAVTVFGMFLSALIVPYAFSDDYPILLIADRLGTSPEFGRSIIDTVSSNGRPFAGLLDDLVFSAAGTINNLRFVRLVSVVGIVVLALLLHWALVRSRVKPALAAVIVVLVCSTPAFQVYGAWAVLFTVPYAAILAGVASFFVVAATDAGGSLVADRLAGAIAALLAALLIYQPAAMFFWVFLAAALVGTAGDWRQALRLARRHLAVAAIALALDFLVVKLILWLVAGDVPRVGRTALTHDPIEKVRWFFRDPLYQSLNLFQLTRSPWLVVIVTTVTVVGMSLLLRREAMRPLVFAGKAVALIPHSFLSSLAAAENSPTYRVLVAHSSMIALYLCLGGLGIWLTARDWLRPRVSAEALRAGERLAVAVGLAFVATGAFIAAKNVTTLFVVPQRTELGMLRSQVAALPTGVRRVAFVQTGTDQGMVRFVTVDEFGIPSTSRDWTPEPALLLVLREEGRLTRDGPHPVVDLLPPWTTTFPRNEPVVDLRGLSRLR